MACSLHLLRTSAAHLDHKPLTPTACPLLPASRDTVRCTAMRELRCCCPCLTTPTRLSLAQWRRERTLPYLAYVQPAQHKAGKSLIPQPSSACATQHKKLAPFPGLSSATSWSADLHLLRKPAPPPVPVPSPAATRCTPAAKRTSLLAAERKAQTEKRANAMRTCTKQPCPQIKPATPLIVGSSVDQMCAQG